MSVADNARFAEEKRYSANNPHAAGTAINANSSVLFAEYAKVKRMLGNGRLEAYCFDGKDRQCHIRGKMRKKVRVLRECAWLHCLPWLHQCNGVHLLRLCNGFRSTVCLSWASDVGSECAYLTSILTRLLAGVGSCWRHYLDLPARVPG